MEQQAIHGDALLETCADGVHPGIEGHAMIAQALLEAMGLTEEAQ